MNKPLLGISLLVLLAVSSASILQVQVATAKSTSSAITDNLTKKLGAFIIIAGDRPDNNSQNNIVNGSDQAYHDLVTYCGFSPTRVYYLGPVKNASHPHVNAITSLPNIQYAIETWAANKVNATDGLGLYLYDHGGYEVMCIPGPEWLNSSTLNSYLNTLYTETGCYRDIIIYDACESGSFAHDLSAPGRIEVMSTSAYDPAYFSKYWSFFAESFWAGASSGRTIAASFIDACEHMAACGVRYTPWIDDNGDGVANPPAWVENNTKLYTYQPYLPNGGDGLVSMYSLIRGESTPAPAPVLQVVLTNPHIYLNVSSLAAIPVWAEINFPASLTDLWARLTPPGWTSPSQPPAVDGIPTMVPDTNASYIELHDYTGSGNYTGSFTFGSQPIPSPVLGDYSVTIIPESDAGVGPVTTSVATVNTNGTAPPDHTPPIVEIMQPGNNTSVNGSFSILAYGNDDQKLASVKLFVDGKQVANLTDPTYPYPDLNYTWNSTTNDNGAHVIRAVATDASGNTATTTVNIQIDNAVSIPGYVGFVVVGASIAGLAYIFVKLRTKHGSRVMST
jgi:hypothetical protein